MPTLPILQNCTDFDTVFVVTETVRMPITVAARRGVSAIASDAAQRRVVLTNHGRVVAVVDSAERIDESLRQVREAARAVTEAYADAALTRHPAVLDLDAVCARLGLDADHIRRVASSRAIP